MPVRIITLCENTALFGYKAEWGLSMAVTRDDFSFLLDTGMSDVALHNARLHQVPLRELNAIVLSHGHRDHSGGLEHFLGETGSIDVLAHPSIFERKYSARRRPPDEDISIPRAKEDYEKLGARFKLSENPIELAPGIVTSGQVPIEFEDEIEDAGLLRLANGEKTPDPLEDDLSVAVDTRQGLFIFLGCAHRGPRNIVEHFREITGQKRVHLVAGGLHLGQASTSRIEEVAKYFDSVGVKKLACSHCTGFDASAILKREFSDGFIHNNSGKRMFFND